MPRRRYSRLMQEELAGPAPAQEQNAPVEQAQHAPQSPMLQLQGMIGNQAVQRMLLQRDDTLTDTQSDTAPALTAPSGGGLLSKIQVIQAIAYYNARSKDYTPQIITQLQKALGTSETGKADAEMVQAVAMWQSGEATGGLKVDGMAGPRTLPYIFKQGLEEETRMEEFAEEASEFQDEWDTLADGDERAEKLMELVNAKLAESQVSECEFEVKDLPDLLGQFSFDTWTIDIGKPAFDKSPVTDAEFNDAVNTIYHEARHAEQWFSMARMLAGQGKKAEKIAKMMGIPVAIANDAVAKPLDPKSMEALVANGWYESVYGVDATKRNNTLNELEAADKELDLAQKALDANDSAANRQRVQNAKERRQRAYDAYHNLPEETDAHRVGDTLTILLELKKTLPDD